MIRREDVHVALFNAMTALGAFKIVSRRNRAPESIGPELSPALFLLQDGETYDVPSPGSPPSKRCLHVLACLYNDVGSDLNATPTTAFNDALDALDAFFRAVNPATGRITLGGLVYSVTRAPGRSEGSPGDREGKAVEIIPIDIVFP